MKRFWLLAVIACAIGVLVAAHIYFFLHLPSGVALGSGAGIVVAALIVKVALARLGIHRLLRRIH